MILLQILLLAQYVSGTTTPIIRSSRILYRWLLPMVFGALVFKFSVWCGAVGYVSGLRAAAFLFPRINDDARSKSHQNNSWFQTFALFWMLYAFFWVISLVLILYADVSGHSVFSIFIVRWMWRMNWVWELEFLTTVFKGNGYSPQQIKRAM